jgi:hypothetical protein
VSLALVPLPFEVLERGVAVVGATLHSPLPQYFSRTLKDLK